MIENLDNLSNMIEAIPLFFKQNDELILVQKPSNNKWSKKEILGHLIDSAINNLQRFTEITFWDKPYLVRRYNQDKLVIANDYQNANLENLISLWLALNIQVQRVIESFDENQLQYLLIIPSGEFKDLQFLATDYIEHMEHHFNQIKNFDN